MSKDFILELNSVYESIKDNKILTKKQLTVLEKWSEESGGTLLPSEFVMGIITSHKRLISKHRKKGKY